MLSKSIGVHKVRGSFRCTRSEPTGCRILGEERNQNFLPVQTDLEEKESSVEKESGNHGGQYKTRKRNRCMTQMLIINGKDS
ncbi:hypothetical protein HKD37_18G049945 [Glycine soja]